MVRCQTLKGSTDDADGCCALPWPSCAVPTPHPWPSTAGLAAPDLSDIYGLADPVMPRPASSAHPCAAFEVADLTHEELTTHCEDVACPGGNATLETKQFCKAITHKHEARGMGQKQRQEICNALLPGPLSWLNCTTGGPAPLPDECAFDNLSLCLQACEHQLNTNKHGRHRTPHCKELCRKQCPHQTQAACIQDCPCKGTKVVSGGFNDTNPGLPACVGNDVTVADHDQFHVCATDCMKYSRPKN